MCIMMLFLGGIQLMGMGLLGAYVGRTYDEAKRRPKFIVDESLGLAAAGRGVRRRGSARRSSAAPDRAGSVAGDRTRERRFCRAGADAILPRVQTLSSHGGFFEGVRHRRSRFHRQQAGRPAARRAATRSSPTTISRPGAGSSCATRSRAARFALVEGDVLDGDALTAAMRGRRLRVSPGGQRRRPVRHRASAEGSRAEHDRDVQRARGDARRTASSASPSPRPARSTASRRCSRRRRTRPFPVQTSLYGASKLAGEGLISAYCEGFGFQACIFRFVSILGERYTHGHVFDFYQQLRADPADAARARQRQAAQVVPLRAGLHRRDLRRPIERADGQGQHLQPRHRRVLQVNDSIGWICGRARRRAAARPTPAASAAGSATARSSSSTARAIRALGWAPKLTIREGDPADARLPARQSLAARSARS